MMLSGHTKKRGDAMNTLHTTPSTIRADLQSALKTMQDKYERLEVLRTRAESAGAIRYDKDRVQSSHNYDLTDVILTIIDAEDAFETAKADYDYLIYVFNVYMDTAHFDTEAKRIWMCRYGHCWSIGRTAKAIGATRSHVQYVLDKNEPTFLSVPA